MPWGADWMVDALQRIPDLHVLGQLLGLDMLTRRLLVGLEGSDRLHLESERLSWDETYASMAAVDIGMVVYHHPAPQFQNNGVASNRLCMFLAMGVPVVASRQPSFEFLERYECGALASTPEEFVDAVKRVRDRLPEMKANALRCAREYIDAPGRYRELEQVVDSFIASAGKRVAPSSAGT
jgi:glycosyltransferase involved in cell wall biosynthesis